MKFLLVALGGLLVFLYFRFGNQAYALGKELLTRAEGDARLAEAHVKAYGTEAFALGRQLIDRAKGSVDKAWAHVRSLV